LNAETQRKSIFCGSIPFRSRSDPAIPFLAFLGDSALKVIAGRGIGIMPVCDSGGEI
jgi:hypothetical protein